MDNVQYTTDIEKYVTRIDLLIFDIDGVLIDTRPSFIATIAFTSQFYVTELLKLPIDVSDVSVKDAITFKGYTGFNNDWDVTEGLIIYCLLRWRRPETTGSLRDFMQDVTNAGTGLSGIDSFIKQNFSPEDFEWIQKHVNKERVRKTFQEFYGGEKYCELLYGFSPQYYLGAGSVENEIILLDKELVKRWKGNTGILTGRMKNETELALQMLDLTKLDRSLVQYTDHILPDKPHPAKIEKILHSAKSNMALYIGDSIDDFLTVVNYNQLGKKSELRFGLVSEDDIRFPESARIFQAPSVNDFIRFVIKRNSRIIPL